MEFNTVWTRIRTLRSPTCRSGNASIVASGRRIQGAELPWLGRNSAGKEKAKVRLQLRAVVAAVAAVIVGVDNELSFETSLYALSCWSTSGRDI